MTKENQLLEKFQVEELEKRHEFAWIGSVKVGGDVNGYGGDVVIRVK